MRLIDEQFTKRPFYGVLRMTAGPRMMGYGVNPKRVQRLKRVMGFEAIYPKPRLSANGPDHNERSHETLGYRTPHEFYFRTRAALAGFGGRSLTWTGSRSLFRSSESLPAFQRLIVLQALHCMILNLKAIGPMAI